MPYPINPEKVELGTRIVLLETVKMQQAEKLLAERCIEINHIRRSINQTLNKPAVLLKENALPSFDFHPSLGL